MCFNNPMIVFLLTSLDFIFNILMCVFIMENKNQPDPSPIKKEFIDLPMDKFISLDPVWKILNKESLLGIYEINKLGVIRNSNTKRIKKPCKKNKNSTHTYPTISLGNSKKNVLSVFHIHRLLALMFLENSDPVKQTQVDHCDKDKFNYSLNNLRWTTPSENNKNRKNLSRERLHFRVYSSDWTFIEEKPYSYWTSTQVRSILTSIKRGLKYKGNYYKTVDTELEEFKRKFGDPAPIGKMWNPENPEENGWAETIYKGRYVDKKGYVLLKNGKITVGFKEDPDNEYSRRAISINGKYEYIHRLVASAFNGKIRLKRTDIVDHIDTDQSNSNIDNLRICFEKDGGQKLNMNNPNTLKKRGIPISQINILTGEIVNTFSSKLEAGKALGLKDPWSIDLDGFILSKGFLWSRKGEEKEKYKKYISYTLNTPKAKKNWYFNIKENCETEARKYKTRTEFSDNSSLAYKIACKNKWMDEFFPKILNK